MSANSIHGSDNQNQTSNHIDRLSDFAQAVYSGLSIVDPNAADRYLHCGQDDYGYVKYCANCAETGPGFYVDYIPRSCMLRICPDCAKRVAGPIRDRYRPIIEHLFSNPQSGYRVRGWTVTRGIQLSDDSHNDVRETLNMAYELFQELTKGQEHAGAIASLEFGENGEKIHVHLIVYSRYVTHEQVKRAWRAITGDSYIVWLRLYENADQAIREGLKYATKAANLSPESLVKLHLALKGARRVRSWGCFYLNKKNPLYHLKGDSSASCQCPDCNSKLVCKPERDFEQLGHYFLQSDAKNVREQVYELQSMRKLLYLTGQLSSQANAPNASNQTRGRPPNGKILATQLAF